MIPELTREGVLPPGLHAATMAEIRRRFGNGAGVRGSLMKGLERVVRKARKIGASRLYLDGSFVTDKKEPRDWDAVLVLSPGARIGSKEAQTLTGREVMKKRFGGDLFTVMEEDAEILKHYVEGVFSHDRDGRAKGLLIVELKEKADGTDQE